jgi:hypothetical protein
MLKVTNAEFVTDPYVAAAALLNHYPERPWGRHQPWPETAEEVKRGDASRLLRLLRCRLAWYGLRSVEVGSVRLLTKDTLSVDLLQASGAFICRVEVDPQSGVIKTSASQAFRCLLALEWQLNSSPRRALSMVQ